MHYHRVYKKLNNFEQQKWQKCVYSCHAILLLSLYCISNLYIDCFITHTETNLQLGVVTTDIIQVNWQQIPGATSYTLTLTDQSGATQPQTVTITDPTNIAHAFQNLTPGQMYSISLTGIGANGTPVPGGTVMATTSKSYMYGYPCAYHMGITCT